MAQDERELGSNGHSDEEALAAEVDRRLCLSVESGPRPAAVPGPSAPLDEAALRDVLLFLYARTGRDFSCYQPETIARRVVRRMQVNAVDGLPAYLTFLRTHPEEPGTLLRDLLISVTHFFRDREAFQALESRVPELFKNKTAADTIRVWVPACASGEEAYSIAMLLIEHARTLDAPPALQVFATDLDEDVLREARNGLYPSSIGTDVSSERLSRFFVKEHRGYRVCRQLREILLFAIHDLLKDSPFFRLDLVSCRNLLIYLNRMAQKRAFETFHFALRPESLLFLGASESTDDCPQLFEAIDKTHRLYVTRRSSRTSLPIPPGLSTSNGSTSERAPAIPEPEAPHLEQELERTKLHLREAVAQHGVSSHALEVRTEELQALNEKLRSTKEELETSREESQSTNEELSTVNLELKIKLDELRKTNSDLHNLMGATAIATVFLDRDLCIMRFTPPAVELFSLIPTDVGRPLSDLHRSLIYPELISDASRVLQQLTPIEREVGQSGGRHFLARLLPYRTLDDRIAGVVLTFVDVTERELAKQAAERAHLELEERVRERTVQLAEANEALRIEIDKQRDAERARQGLQRRLVHAQEEERQRISRELHDEVGQQIVAMMLNLGAISVEGLPADTAAKLRALRDSTQLIGTEIHQLASQLRPVALDSLGLAQALAAYLEGWRERSGVAVDFFSSGIEEPRLPSAIEITLYRIVQEATNNVVRHAGACNVSVSIERRKDHVIGIVEDDGKGFDFDHVRGSALGRIGIAGMQERAAIVNGQLTIDSAASGTTVRVTLPIPSV